MTNIKIEVTYADDEPALVLDTTSFGIAKIQLDVMEEFIIRKTTGEEGLQPPNF